MTRPGIATESASAVAQGAGGARRAVVEWLGRRPYAPLLERQRALQQQVAAGEAPDTLLLVEHDPVVTLGRRADRAGIPVPEALARAGIAVVPTERGGNVTYHGPGQLVAYPILDLRRLAAPAAPDLRDYVGRLEAVVLRVLAAYGIDAVQDASRHGVFTPRGKIASVGIHVSRWVTMHGVALNVAPAMAHWALIQPCGLADVRAASIAEYVDPAPPLPDVAARFVDAFAAIFGLRCDGGLAP